MNRGGNEHIVLHDCFRNRTTAAAEIQVRPEDVVPLRSNISGSRRKGQTPAGEMAKGATAGTRRRCCSGAVGPVRAVLPFTISKLLIVCTETWLLPHYKYRRQVSRNETAVGVQNGLASRILLHGVALEQDDRAVGKIEDLSRTYGSSGIVTIYLSDLAILVIVKGIQQMESILVTGRKPNTVYSWRGQRLRVPDEKY